MWAMVFCPLFVSNFRFTKAHKGGFLRILNWVARLIILYNKIVFKFFIGFSKEMINKNCKNGSQEIWSRLWE
jgi:hypothetical protein